MKKLDASVDDVRKVAQIKLTFDVESRQQNDENFSRPARRNNLLMRSYSPKGATEFKDVVFNKDIKQ